MSEDTSKLSNNKLLDKQKRTLLKILVVFLLLTVNIFGSAVVLYAAEVKMSARVLPHKSTNTINDFDFRTVNIVYIAPWNNRGRFSFSYDFTKLYYLVYN